MSIKGDSLELALTAHGVVTAWADDAVPSWACAIAARFTEGEGQRALVDAFQRAAGDTAGLLTVAGARVFGHGV